MTVIEESIHINADAQRLYGMWIEFEQYPRFMPNVHAVRRTGETTMRWETGEEDRRTAWDAQVIKMSPEEKIVLQTVGADPPVTATIRFQPDAGGVIVSFALETEGGAEAELETREFLRQALHNFKAIADQGPPHSWT